jgi:hypothetical protein
VIQLRGEEKYLKQKREFLCRLTLWKDIGGAMWDKYHGIREYPQDREIDLSGIKESIFQLMPMGNGI